MDQVDKHTKSDSFKAFMTLVAPHTPNYDDIVWEAHYAKGDATRNRNAAIRKHLENTLWRGVKTHGR